MTTFGAELNGAPNGGMPHCFRLNEWLGRFDATILLNPHYPKQTAQQECPKCKYKQHLADQRCSLHIECCGQAANRIWV